jgi:hypothetical protein
MILHPEIEQIAQPGYVYLTKLEDVFNTEYKIGKTRNIKKRMETLRAATGLHVTLIAYGHAADYSVSERHMHETYYENCRHGEYFKFTPGELYNVIKTLEFICCNIETDYTDPVCPHDGRRLVYRPSRLRFECPVCGHTVSFDHYMVPPQRMLPYCCDETNDDDMMFMNDKYDSIYYERRGLGLA